MSENKKTIYQFTVNAPEETINQVFQSWLAANGFGFQPKQGANYYCFNDPMVKGKRSLEYYIHGTQVTIAAYVGTFEKPKALEGFAGAVSKQMYRDDLTSLFKALEQLNAYYGQQSPGDMAQQQNMSQQNIAQPYSPSFNNPASAVNTQQIAQGFMAENEKKKENMVVIGFVMAVLGLLLSCFGFAYGVILIMLEFYFAIQGLQTKKKGLAITTIVLASVSIVFLLFALVLSALLA